MKHQGIILVVVIVATSILFTGCNPHEIPIMETATGQPSFEPSPNLTLHTAADSTAALIPKLTPVPTPVSAVPERGEIFVCVSDYIPSIVVELKYATTGNITSEVIYNFTDAYLRYGTVKKLEAVQNELIKLGYCLKIWDAFRPVSAQFDLWKIMPSSAYVANPNTGYSSHSRGNTVDVTLVTIDGAEIAMPTGFDDFSTKADRDYSDVSKAVAENAMLLEVVMEHNGFNSYYGEWWHFSDNNSYSVDTEFSPK